MNSTAPKTSLEFRGSPLVIGEVLLDHFPDGRSILGGAPFNVAWNLQGFGRKPTFVSSVGDDQEGKQIKERMANWGMKLDGLQTNPEHQTGAVQVTLENGQPSYEIVFPRFVDINIREPWFDAKWLPELLEGADFVKLNDEELAGITGMPCETDDDVKRAVEKVSSLYGAAVVYFITCGARGAYAITHDQTYFASAPPPESMVDTVGAGDGFAAATIDGILAGISYQQVIDRAVGFASRICGLRGATSNDESIYQLE